MDEKQLLNQARDFLRKNRNDIVADISELVAIPSVEGTPGPNAPFGPGPRQALDRALAIAERMGFSPREYNGFMGWFDLPGKEQAHIATITHLDVVPPGNGWHTDPYQAQLRENWLIGRGTDDDKGAAVYCMYLAKFFREAGLPLCYTLRTLLGCNEETGMQDVPAYLEVQPQPAFCLSMDALFPVCNGEKGLFEGELRLPVTGGPVRLRAGSASNMISETAECWLENFACSDPLPKNIKVDQEGKLWKVTARGTGAHCAMPQRGVSAIGVLLDFLFDHGLLQEKEQPALALLRRLHASAYGEGIGIQCSDRIFGALTCVGGILDICDGWAVQNVNIRFPMTTSGARLAEQLAEMAAQVGGSFRLINMSEPFYLPADDPVLQTLLGAYRQVTGGQEGAYTWGGGTYARRFARGVSFGPGLAGEEKKPPYVGDCHGPDEGTNLDTMDESFLVYVLAVARLQKMELHQLLGHEKSAQK